MKNLKIINYIVKNRKYLFINKNNFNKIIQIKLILKYNSKRI